MFTYGFESMDWITASWEASPSTLALSSTTGVTEGMSALEITNSSYWDAVINIPSADVPDLLAAMAAGGNEISFDITSNAAAGNDGGWAQLVVAISGDGLAWTQTAQADVTGADMTTFTASFAAVDLSSVGTGYFNINLSFNQNAGTLAYVDNMVIGTAAVPEPSAYALGAALPVLLLALKRRRRK